MLHHVVKRETLRLLVASDDTIPDMPRRKFLGGQLEPILQAALRSGKSDVPLVLFVGRCSNDSGERLTLGVETYSLEDRLSSELREAMDVAADLSQPVDW